MKFLIVGIGNIGLEYESTRHNVGFQVLDKLAERFKESFEPARHGDMATLKHKGRQFILIKPSTFVNLSGKAVKYWLDKEKVPADRLLVVVDDIALPVGALRMRARGGDAGHNGLKDIADRIGQGYPRLRVGIGDDFPRGHQVEHVLGEWTKDELTILDDRMDTILEMILSFGTQGLERTMNHYNKA